jgi:hypothetical protein
VSRPSVAAVARALLARAELVRGDPAAAWEHVEEGRRAIHALSPSSRAVRLLREVAREAGLAATPLPDAGGHEPALPG